MTSTFVGFSEEDLKRIKSGDTNSNNEQIKMYVQGARKIDEIGLKSRRIAKKLPTLPHQILEDFDIDAFEKCKLSLKSPTTPINVGHENVTCGVVENNTEEKKIKQLVSNHRNENVEEHRRKSTKLAPDVVKCIDNYNQDELTTHKEKLEELQLRQKLMEEQNKKRKEMLAKALADRTKQTEEEIQKLEKIKKELIILDGQFAQDVALLRKKIDHACISYSEAEKHYLKVENEFLQAKINLQKEKEKKELLTEHLCALITHNETRKAQKLETLMLELANNKDKVISEMVGNNITLENNDVATQDDEPVIIDGVEQKTGKIIETLNNNK